MRGSESLVADPGPAYLPDSGLDPLARYGAATIAGLGDGEMRETVIYRFAA